MRHRIFIFGTLKQGFPNHHYIKHQELIGEFHTEQSYPLYLVGDRHSPWMMDQSGEGLVVKGQVFGVDDETLAVLDKLERIRFEDGYRRQQIHVRKVKDKSLLQVECYLKPRQIINPTLVKLGPIDEYLPQHASLYRSR